MGHSCSYINGVFYDQETACYCKTDLGLTQTSLKFYLICSSAFGLTLDTFYNLSKPQFSFFSKLEKHLFVNEVMFVKISGTQLLSRYQSFFLHFFPQILETIQDIANQSSDLGTQLCPYSKSMEDDEEGYTWQQMTMEDQGLSLLIGTLNQSITVLRMVSAEIKVLTEQDNQREDTGYHMHLMTSVSSESCTPSTPNHLIVAFSQLCAFEWAFSFLSCSHSNDILEMFLQFTY